MGPEAVQKFINPEEVVKRLAAASGIDALNLVKSMQEIQQKEQAAKQQAMEMEKMKQQPAMMKAPVLDPSKNAAMAAELKGKEEPSLEQPPEQQ
jgi:hypothetical protein